MRVMLVDDDPHCLRALQASLELVDIRTVIFERPVNALNYFTEKDEIDVVISDYRMRGMDGFELARRLCALQPGLPVVLISAYDVPDHSEQVVSVLKKPLALNTLLTTLKNIEDSIAHRDRMG